ncbi:Magnetosome protein MmsF. MamF-like protein [Gammaproteobacteria bacterium]
MVTITGFRLVEDIVYLMNTKSSPYQRKIMALFSYLGVLTLIPLIFNTDDDYVAFHAKQGLVLWMWGVISIFSLYLPVIGLYFSSSSTFLILVCSGYGILSVLLNKCWKIPGIFMLATKL